MGSASAKAAPDGKRPQTNATSALEHNLRSVVEYFVSMREIPFA
jgi:hypothetical protein